MRTLGMLPKKKATANASEPLIARATRWLRAPASGIVRMRTRLGNRVHKGEALATVGDPFGDVENHLAAPFSGIVIGRTNLPLVHEGDAMIHLAAFEDIAQVEDNVEELQMLASLGQ